MPRFFGLLAALAALSCRSSGSDSGELSRGECAALVRRQQSLEASGTGGLDAVLAPTLRASIEACMKNGTQSAYRCVMQADKPADLDICKSLFK